MIFVTGGTGMLGAYLLLELCKQNKAIVAAKRKSSNLDIPKKIFKYYSDDYDTHWKKIEWVDVDLFSQSDIEEKLENIEEIYHCAAMISASRKKKNEMLHNNKSITGNMVNAALQKNIAKFCYVSSIAALGSEGEGKASTERTLWKEDKNNSSYSISKYYSEMEVWRGIAEGLNAVIINPSVILGIGDWNKGSAQLISTIDNNLKYYTLGSSGFVDAEDTAQVMIKLMQEPTAFGQNYIVNSENRSYQSIFKSIAKALQINPPKTLATPFLTSLAWRGAWLQSIITGKEALITKESAQTAHKKLSYDNSKLTALLDFKFKNIDESIKEIVRAYKKENVI
jgi:nucleoside-diphosphate-sugar epimerase